MSLQRFIEKTRKDVDRELEASIKTHEEYEKLKYALEKGKRLRPILSLLVFKALKGKDYKKAVKAAVAIELAHSASLVHDDIIDQDKERRGKLPIFKSLGFEDAVLLGHRMISHGLRTIVNHGTEIMKTVIDTWDSALRGETKDIMLSRRKLKELEPPAKKFYFDVILDKTASLFSGAAKVGAQEAGADLEIQELVNQYGQNVGLAYQLADDYCDMKKGKIETLPIVLMSQLEENIKRSFFELIDEGKITPVALMDRMGFDAKNFFVTEIRKAIEEAEKIVEDERMPESEYKEMLKQTPSFFVNEMFKEIDEQWSL